MGDNDIGVVVGHVDLNDLKGISVSMMSLASQKAEQVGVIGPVDDDDLVRSEVAELVGLASVLDSVIVKVHVSRTNLLNLEAVNVVGAPVGTLSTFFSELLVEYNISIQKYWNGTLVGKSVYLITC